MRTQNKKTTRARINFLFVLTLVVLATASWAAEARSRRAPVSQQEPAHETPTPDPDRMELVRQAPVVVVAGSADHMDQVLRKAKMKFVVVQPSELALLPLHSQQVLMVNCRGVMNQAARARVERFVRAGGFLYTTDHAVHELVEKIFPRTIAWDRKTTTQEVFKMKAQGKRGLLSKISSRRWQLAGGGYLFKVLDQEKVQVLMSSAQVARKYNHSGALGARFRHHDGTVIHVTGHFYSQPGQSGAMAGAGRAFEQLSANVVAAKQTDNVRINRLYSKQPKRKVTLRSAPNAAAAAVALSQVTTQQLGKRSRVRVLQSKDDYVQVRDEQGNEGWVEASAL